MFFGGAYVAVSRGRLLTHFLTEAATEKDFGKDPDFRRTVEAEYKRLRNLVRDPLLYAAAPPPAPRSSNKRGATNLPVDTSVPSPSSSSSLLVVIVVVVIIISIGSICVPLFLVVFVTSNCKETQRTRSTAGLGRLSRTN